MAHGVVATVKGGPVVRGGRRRRVAWAGIVVALAALAPSARAESGIAFTAPVVAVVDGDTLVVRWSGGSRRVEVAGVDCPETDQPFGTAAAALTRLLALGESVRVTVTGRTAAGGSVARVTFADGQDLAAALVKAGLGWSVPRADGGRGPLLDPLEREARAARRGLWSASAPVAPWRHRGDPAPAQPQGLAAAPDPPPVRRPAPAPLVSKPRDCIPRSRCCKVCTTGQACGNSCISARYTCHKGRGCACDSYEVCG